MSTKVGSTIANFFGIKFREKPEPPKEEAKSEAPALAPDRLQLSKANPREIGVAVQTLVGTAVKLRARFDDTHSDAHQSRIAMRALVDQVAAITKDSPDPQLKTANALAEMGLKLDSSHSGSASGNWSGQKALTELVNQLATLPMPEAAEGQTISKDLSLKALTETTLKINGKFGGGASGTSAAREVLESSLSQMQEQLKDDSNPKLAGVKAIVDLKAGERHPDTLGGDSDARKSLVEGFKHIAEKL